MLPLCGECNRCSDDTYHTYEVFRYFLFSYDKLERKFARFSSITASHSCPVNRALLSGMSAGMDATIPVFQRIDDLEVSKQASPEKQK